MTITTLGSRRGLKSCALAILAVPILASAADWTEGAYVKERTVQSENFDPRLASHLDRAESYFLEDIYAIAAEASGLNTKTMLWFRTAGAEGVHADDYLLRMRDLRDRLANLETSPRIRSIRDLLLEALALQGRFVSDWNQALIAGDPFESQLTKENAYHEGLHRSHRLLLKVYAELRALFPEIGGRNQRAFRDLLAAVDFN